MKPAKFVKKYLNYANNQVAFEYSPLRLADYIRFEGKFAIVNKEKLFKADDDRSLFFAALNLIYGWNCIGDAEDLTVYFFNDTSIAVSGVYNEKDKRPMSQLPVATYKGSGYTAVFTYPEETYADLIKKIS